MKKYKLTKVIASLLLATSVLVLNPIGANAAWKQDSTGWWYTTGNSWATGWMKIDGKWYYFDSNGYMAHDTTIDNYKLDSDGVWITTPLVSKNTASSEKIADVTVGTAQEFVNAIGSNKRILLKPGIYNL